MSFLISPSISFLVVWPKLILPPLTESFFPCNTGYSSGGVVKCFYSEKMPWAAWALRLRHFNAAGPQQTKQLPREYKVQEKQRSFWGKSLHSTKGVVLCRPEAPCSAKPPKP